VSAALVYDFADNKRLEQHLAALAMLELSELAEAISFEGEEQTRRRIQQEKESPDGTPWPEWSERYAETRHGGHSLLQGEGSLLDSIQASPEGSTAIWGSNLVYAALQNFGGDPVGINVPSREYLGLSEENLADIEQLAIDWIDSQTGVSA
jgi:phage virion morphogenesis protein